MTDPWLTVVMPTYNGAEFIRATLDSLAAQTEGGFEVVALDEASTDGTPDIIAEYADRFPIRQIDGAGLNGWIAKTNRGFDLARTPYATMLHQDDFWRPGRMAALRRALDEAAEAPVFVVHPVDFVDGAGRVIGKWSPPPSLGRGLVSPGDMLTRLCIQNFIAIPGSIFSSEAARSVGGVEADMRYTGDWDFYLKLAARGPSLILRERLAAYRLHGNALTLKVAADAELFAAQLAAPVERHLPNVPAEARDWVAKRAAFSNAVNAALAGRFHGAPIPWWRLIRQGLALGPLGLPGYVRDSRIIERAEARLRMRKEG